jgi:hypothetical protein
MSVSLRKFSSRSSWCSILYAVCRNINPALSFPMTVLYANMIRSPWTVGKDRRPFSHSKRRLASASKSLAVSTPCIAPSVLARSDLHCCFHGQIIIFNLHVDTYASQGTNCVNKERRAKSRLSDVFGSHIGQEAFLVHERDTRTMIVGEKG